MTKAKKKIMLKKLVQHNTIWHPESRLVFKSKKEQVVVGRLDETTEEIVVEEDLLDACTTWKFKIDPSLLESDSDEEEVEVKEEASAAIPEEKKQPREIETNNLREEVQNKKKKKSTKASKDSADSFRQIIDLLHSQFEELENNVRSKSQELLQCEGELETERNRKNELEEKLAKIKEHFM